jgi:hypothetical protein
MTKLIRCLLFEDDLTDGELIIRSLFAALPREFELSITWLRSPLDLKGQPRIYWTTNIPLIITDRDDAIEVNSPQGKRKPIDGLFWQKDFACAILDVFDRKSASTFGEVLAEWLNYARHTGPIVITSLHGVALARFLLLPKLRFMAKKDAEKFWTQLVAEYVINEIKSSEYNLWPVGSRGRDPESRAILKPYWDLISKETPSDPSRWRMLFVGSEDLDEAIKEFFDWKAVKTGLLQNASTKLNALNWDSLLIDMETKRQAKPDIVVIEFKETATISAELKKQIERVDSDLLSKPPHLVLFANRFSEYDHETELFILKHGVVVVPTDQFLERPTQWAEEAVEDLVQRVEIFQLASKLTGEAVDEEQRFPLTCAQRLIDAHLRVLLMARSTWSITGDQGRPSIIRWLSSYPLSGMGLKTSYSKTLGAAKKVLFKKKLISQGLMRRLGNDREGKHVAEAIVRRLGSDR